MNTLKVMIFALGFTSITASAAIINHVDFPDAFVQSKEKANTVETEQVTAFAEAK